MGSKSDLPVMQDAIDILKEFGIKSEINIVSAHRTPDKMFKYGKDAKNNGISGNGESLLNESSIRDLFREELSVYGKNFKSFEHPQNFALFAEEWSIENGLLTPTLKLKREVVEKKFKDQIESLY